MSKLDILVKEINKEFKERVEEPFKQGKVDIIKKNTSVPAIVVYFFNDNNSYFSIKSLLSITSSTSLISTTSL